MCVCRIFPLLSEATVLGSVPKHEITAQTPARPFGRGTALVYGELRGALEEEGPGAVGDCAETHKRLDVSTEAWVGIAPARNTRPLDSHMMVAQEAPHDEPDWHLAFELYPLHRAPGATKIRDGVETGHGLVLDDVAPEHAARQLGDPDVPAEPIELDSLFAVTQPEAAMLP